MAKCKPECRTRQCAACGREFCPWCRDVSTWPIIDDKNASEHCATCWKKMAKTEGRELGAPRS